MDVAAECSYGSGVWHVERVYDAITREEVGDPGVYEFDGFEDFSSRFIRGVFREFETTFVDGRQYEIRVTAWDGSSELGSGWWRFRYDDKLREEVATYEEEKATQDRLQT